MVRINYIMLMSRSQGVLYGEVTPRVGEYVQIDISSPQVGIKEWDNTSTFYQVLRVCWATNYKGDEPNELRPIIVLNEKDTLNGSGLEEMKKEIGAI